MWILPGMTEDQSWFRPFEPVEMLYEFDGPRIFTLRDAEGDLNLAYWSDEDELVTRYVVAPTTTWIVDALRTGRISVLEALNQSRCWLCDIAPDGAIADCLRVEFDSLPPDALPVVGTTLLPRRPFEFTLWLAPDARSLNDWSNALFEAGANDCSPGEHCGEPYVAFHREAEFLEKAVRSAHRHVQAAGCRVLRCEITAEEMAGWTAN